MLPHEIPAFPDTRAAVHPRKDEITDLTYAWMAESGLFPDAQLRDRWVRKRTAAWSCHFYPDVSFERALVNAMTWEWWTYLDSLAPKFSFGAWARFAMDLERTLWRGAVPASTSPSADTPSVAPAMLAALADICRRTTELYDPRLYRHMVAAASDALNGFTIEAANHDLGRLPAVDPELSPDCEYLQIHRKSVGMIFDTLFIEGGMEFLIPDALRCSEPWQDLLEAAYDVMIMQNDLNGFARDFAAGDPNNSVYLLHAQHALPPDEAATRVAALLTARIATFLDLERAFPGQVRHLPVSPDDIRRAREVAARLKAGSQGILTWYGQTLRYQSGEEPM
jgi:Terpene synthase family 2, C-terminal metal binding